MERVLRLISFLELGIGRFWTERGAPRLENYNVSTVVINDPPPRGLFAVYLRALVRTMVGIDAFSSMLFFFS